MAKAAPSTPAERPEPQPTHMLPPDAFTPEELEIMAKGTLAPVDVKAVLAWMNGEGPDPWIEPSG